MDKLWAPWRAKYITEKKRKACVFCHGRGKKSKDYIVFKSNQATAMLNLYPYNNGHILVAPVRHVARMSQLSDREVLGLFRAVEKAQGILEKALKPQGFNIGINLSRSAGAGITGHLHIHIVPRWIGDTNFMPVLFNTKIISESLGELHKKLKDAQSKKD